MAEIINLMDAATKQLMKHDPAFNDKAETVLAILRATEIVKSLRTTQNGALHKSLAAAMALAHKTGDTIYVASRAAQTIYDRGGSTRLIPWLDKLVKAGLLLSASKLNRAEGSMKLGPLLEMYLK